MEVSAAVMVVSDRGGVIATTIRLGVRCDICRAIKVCRSMIIKVSDKSHGRPLDRVACRVLHFHQAMQVERRQYGDA